MKLQPTAKRAGDPSFYRPELDALRFFAFACVFVNHLWISNPRQVLLWQTGGFGLQLFFLLSAYLIVSLLLRERAATHTVHVGAFMVRRVLRIWPLYFAVILLNQLIGLVWPFAALSRAAIGSMLLLCTNLYVIHSGWHLQMLSALWSISVEEQFYLVVPWVGRSCSKRSMTLFFLGVLASSYLMLLHLGHTHADTILRVWPNSLVQFQFFAAGGLLALSKFQLRPSVPARLACFTAGLGLWALAQLRFAIYRPPNSPSTTHLCAGYACVLVGCIAIFLAFLGAPLRFPRWVLCLGTISYGLYVFHVFWLYLLYAALHMAGRYTWTAAALALLGTCTSAALSYRYFERPVLRWKRRFEPIHTRP